jgi:FlaA1/EpsC-like NDP-sugar epimerase
MRLKLKELIDKGFLPRWIILMVDMAIASTSFLLTYLLRFNLFSEHVDVPMMLLQFMTGLPFFMLAAAIFKPHRGILRHSTMQDAVIVAKAHLIFSGGYYILSFFGHNIAEILLIPWSVIIVHYFLSVFLMVAFRLGVQFTYRNLLEKPNDSINIMIYGAGVVGSIAQSVIMKDTNIHYNIIGFIDDNPSLWNSRVGGINVFSPEKAFENVIAEQNVQEMILAISGSRVEIERKREIVDQCLASRLKVKEVSDPSSLIDGKLDEGKITNVRIEDLLGREPISMKVEAISRGIAGKRVMVTGGAGSIGSEIVRQLVFLNPESITIVDQAESAVFEINNEIIPFLGQVKLYAYVADVTNANRMRKIFSTCQPQIIYHAAAYKHVPIMELQPNEAISNNVGGTKTLADLSIEFSVEKFVMISTDKAVNPTNIMGATKRICEIYIQALSQHPGIKTQFITTRFGNVLGSNGSVIPIFKRQISNGGPVTVTHRDIIRYFMTIPEACQLVMEAGFMGNGGEIYLFDMGKPVRIYDLAERMISLSGFIPHTEIKIIETGLRPGEKLFEELLADKEETLPTSNKKIMIGKIRPLNYKASETNILELLKNLNEEDEWKIVTRMKKIVPEFESKNSQFEVLDQFLKPSLQDSTTINSRILININGVRDLDDQKESKEDRAIPSPKKNSKSAIKRLINTFHLLTFNLFY